ncbi:MAG: phage holin [Firmicutes bacterium]|nr:phage holin [Bacillota bacterium]
MIWVIFLIMYQILSILGITTPVSEDSISETPTLIINISAVLGIIVDPTTANINDNERAMGYEEPKK